MDRYIKCRWNFLYICILHVCWKLWSKNIYHEDICYRIPVITCKNRFGQVRMLWNKSWERYPQKLVKHKWVNDIKATTMRKTTKMVTNNLEQGTPTANEGLHSAPIEKNLGQTWKDCTAESALLLLQCHSLSHFNAVSCAGRIRLTAKFFFSRSCNLEFSFFWYLMFTFFRQFLRFLYSFR